MSENTNDLWGPFLEGIPSDILPDGTGPPAMEFEGPTTKEAEKLKGKKVFVQKLITEIWMYTDIEGKTFSHKGTQDIIIAGEMDYEEALKLIEGTNQKKRRNSKG